MLFDVSAARAQARPRRGRGGNRPILSGGLWQTRRF
jgi:hypothetical protein